MRWNVIVAGVLGGVTVFVWGMLSHMVLPLGEAGISTLPQEREVLTVLRDRVPQGGLYLFPMEQDPSKWEEAYRTQPHGLLVVRPAGEPLAFGRRLLVEFGTSLVGGLLAALLLATWLPALGSWRSGLLAGAGLGCFAAVAIDLSYANWYGFPAAYALAQLVDQVVGWGLAGAVMGWWLGRRRVAERTLPA